MIASLDTWSGFAIFVEVFWKSGVALGAALGANALLRKRSADLRRLTLSTSVAAMCVAAVFVPALPRWTAAAPDWLRVQRAAAPAAVEPPRGPAVLDTRPRPLLLQGPSQSGDLPSHRVPVIPVIWFAGSAALMLRFLAGLRKLRRLRIASDVLSDEDLLDLGEAGRRRRVLLLRSETIGAPVTWGIVRPVILVPSVFDQLPAECRSQVLCHELAHVESHDFFLRVLAEIARAVIWFQPLIWIARRQLREDQELACDDRVLAAGCRSSAYAKLLLEWNDRLVEKRSTDCGWNGAAELSEAAPVRVTRSPYQAGYGLAGGNSGCMASGARHCAASRRVPLCANARANSPYGD